MGCIVLRSRVRVFKFLKEVIVFSLSFDLFVVVVVLLVLEGLGGGIVWMTELGISCVWFVYFIEA